MPGFAPGWHGFHHPPTHRLCEVFLAYGISTILKFKELIVTHRGIEPRSSARKADVLADIRMGDADCTGVEPVCILP